LVPTCGPVADPHISLFAYTEQQSEDLAYAALEAILEEGPIADLSDVGLERIMRVAKALPDARGEGAARCP
jgi:hypothetical protein